MKPISGICVVLAVLSSSFGTPVYNDIKDLTFIQKLRLVSHHPELKEIVLPPFKQNREASAPLDYTLGHFFIDVTTFAIQLAKLEPDFLLPQLSYILDLFGFYDAVDYRDTHIIGSENVKLDSRVTDSKLEISFHAPRLGYESRGYTSNSTNLDTYKNNYRRGERFFFENLTLFVTAELKLVPEIGLQLENFNMSYGLDKSRLQYENTTVTHPNGTVEEWGMTEYILDDFLPELEDGDVEITQAWLNCFLRNGRVQVDDETCEDMLQDETEVSSFQMILQALAVGQHPFLFK